MHPPGVWYAWRDEKISLRVERIQALLRFVKRVARVGVVVVLKKIGFKVCRSSIYRRSNKLQRKVPMQ